MTRRQLFPSAAATAAFARFSAAAPGETPVPFADAKPFNPERPNLPWDKLESWLTPTPELFRVGHYGFPDVDMAKWKLDIGGMVERPRSLSLDQLKRRAAKERTVTIECSGNGPAGGLIGNSKWTGTPLAPLLKECGVKSEAIEAVFFAADQGKEKIRNNDYEQQFARSLDLRDAIKPDVLLCWALNGEPLDKNHGAPLRLIVPGWYGIAWVKWLTRIELHDRKYQARFMGRDYVTIRGEKQGDKTIWRETAVGRMNLKSVAARAARREDGSIRVTGAAWSDGTPIKSVDVRIDGGEWAEAKLERRKGAEHCWTFWSYEWRGAKPGEHTVASRATDARGRVQPEAGDPSIALKKTYWEANQQAVRKINL